MVTKTIEIKIESGKAERNIDRVDNKMRGLENTANSTNRTFGNLKTTVVAVAAALQVRQIQRYADAFTSAQNQIRQTTRTSQELAARTEQLFQVAQRSRVEFSATAELYTQLALSTENLNLSTDELARLTETIGKSFAVSGKSAAESAGAIRQLGQAFSAGALRGDEFNSIAEGAPEIMRALQRSLNLTQGELRDFAATGGITAEILVTALGGAADVIDAKLANANKTFAQFAQEAENNAINFVGSSDLINNSISGAGQSVVFLSENLDVLANVVLIAAAAGVSRLTASLITNTVQAIRNTTAMKAATVATTAFNRALSLLGGPLGVALTAASAIAIYATSTDDAISPTEKLQKEVDSLAASFSNLNRGQIDVQLAEATEAANSLSGQLNAAQQELDKLLNAPLAGTSLGGSQIQLEKQRETVRQLQEEFDEAIRRRDALFQAGITLNLEGATDQSGQQAVAAEPQDNFINREQFKTESLRNELRERLALQRAFNQTVVDDDASLAEIELAAIEFRRQAELASLERQRADFALKSEQEVLQIELDEKLKGEAKLSALSEVQTQQLIQEQIFESERLRIKQESEEAITEVSNIEAENRAIANQRAAEITIDANQRSVSTVLGFLEQFSGKSEALAKALVVLRGAEGVSNAIINSQVAATRALAELGPIAGPPVAAKMISYGKLSAGIIAANAVLKLGSSGGGAGSGAGSINVGGTNQTSAPQRQDPVQRQEVIEFRGLTEVARELRNLDPGEVLPVEFTQRIVSSLVEFERISGGQT